MRQCMCRAPRNMASNDVDHKNDVVPSSSRGHSYNDNPLHKVPQPPQKYKLRCAVKENHQHPIYCVAFSRHIHRHNEGGIDNLNSAVFATCGGNYSTIYEIDNSGNIDGESPLTIRQVYRDVDPDEVFYTCAFGGRGVVGSPVGFSTAGGDTTDNRDRDMHGSISFGHELHKEKQQYNSMNGVKRLKVDDAARPCGKLDNENASKSQSTFHLPFSASQTGPPLLCLAGTRSIIKVIDTYRRSLYMTLSGHGNDITDLKFSPTNEWLLLSSSKDESVRLWNLQRGVNVAVFSGDYGHRGQVLSVSWHMSGSKIATCAMDNTVKLWRIFSDSNKQEGGEGDSKCGPIETAVRKSFTVVPDSWSGNNQACQKFKTIFHQFPYFSTDEAHTNYVGKSILLVVIPLRPFSLVSIVVSIGLMSPHFGISVSFVHRLCPICRRPHTI